MKILQLVTKRQHRGAEVFAYNLSRELIHSGVKIIFAGLYKNNQNVLELKQALNTDLISQKPAFFSFKLLNNLIRLINNEQPDIIQCNGSDTLKYAVAANFFVKKRRPVVYRNISTISKWLNSKHKKILYKMLFKKVDFVTSVGHLPLQDFTQTLQYPKEKTKVIRRGIPLLSLDKTVSKQEVINEFNLNQDDKIIIHVGNFSPEKNHDFLIESLEELLRSNENIKLMLVGKGVLFDTIKRKVETKKLTDKVILTGFRKDIPKLISASDLLVLTSKIEGVPGVILEAAVQKVPGIAVNVGGVPEVLIDNETGLLLQDFDKNNFKTNVFRLLRDDKLRQTLGKKAYNMVQTNFNPENTKEEFIDVYKKLIYDTKN